VLAVATALVAAAPSAAAAAPRGADAAAGGLQAGVAVVDASWHVGASAGQYASDGTFAGDHGLDPTVHSVRRAASYGIQSRLTVRALVIQGPDGRRVAIVKNDLYIPQDLLYRRTALLLEQGDSGIGRENLTMAVTHNHSSPYYSSPSWGTWVFQDVFDVRFYEYMARRQAAAVEKAAAEMVPVRVGATVARFDKTARHSYGPAIGDDGTPAGFPHSESDHDMTLVRFDDVSDPRRPKPLANLVNYALHPEFLNGNDLLSADYLGPFERMLDRETGAVTVFTQGSVGTAEPERSSFHSTHERLEFTHREYAQAEYGARLMADHAVGLFREIAGGRPRVPFFRDAPLKMVDAWYPGPFSHAYPGVSNCRTDKAGRGRPQIPLAGLPDCNTPSGLARSLGVPLPEIPIDPGLTTEELRAAGIPVPENYSVPSYTGLEEDVNVHLQAIRLGDILITVCSCEQWKDQSENVETRTDTVAGNEHVGYDWGARCERNGDGSYGDGPNGWGSGTWTCPNPHGGDPLTGLSDKKVQRMRAQVLNPANGWNDAENVASAESEPVDVRRIKGNFTHDDDERSAALGYRLTIPIGMANDYNGYIASYREYQRGDHYRKALTGWGAHSMDYMATRLVTLGRRLKDPGWPLPRDQVQEQALYGKVIADLAKNDREAQALGTIGSQLVAAYEALLPSDGEPRAVEQPADVQRFGAAFFTWVGGSNFTDNPVVAVQRRTRSGWADYADQTGEVPVTLEFPQGEDVPSYASGTHEWRWTAHFEAFVAPFDTGAPCERRRVASCARATPPGEYRFVVRGARRAGRAPAPYEIVSESFHVAPWDGIAVEDLRVEPDGRAGFRVGPRTTREFVPYGECRGEALSAEIGPIDYPDTYESPSRFVRRRHCAIRDREAPADVSKVEWYCFTCSFRPWLDVGDAHRVTFVFRSADGSTESVRGERRGDRWVSERALEPGEQALVPAGGVRDAYGNRNGAASGAVER
jgi:hypothetical protein